MKCSISEGSLIHVGAGLSLHRGVWNVPFITSAILFSGDWLKQLRDLPNYSISELDPEMSFALWMREKVSFLYQFEKCQLLMFFEYLGSLHVHQ